MSTDVISDVTDARFYPLHLLNNPLPHLGDDETAQVIAYLAAMNAKVGLLLNFGRSRLEYHRILPPKSTEGWQQHIAKYLWRPDSDQILDDDNG